MRTACDRSGANGNGASSRGTRRTDNARGQLETNRFLFWTEDEAAQSERRASLLAFPSQSSVGAANRLYTVADERYYSYYAYDHTGQRTLKMTGDASTVDVNAWEQHTYGCLDHVTLYPSPYMVLTEQGYTKHYYAGTERVAARIGSGGLSYDATCVTGNGEVAKRSDELFWSGVKLLNGRGNKPEDFKEMSLVDAKGKEVDWLKKIDLDKLAMSWQLEAKLDPGKIHSVIDDNAYPAMSGNTRYENEPDVYFYHSDHLGGASWITDVNGKPVQHLQYLPFGEPYVNQHPAGYQERYTFTGKERDEETGYGYFGARYMDHELMTMWLSVDPMMDKYPGISPYNYCMWNPVKLVDPDGNIVLPYPGSKPEFIDYLNQVKAYLYANHSGDIIRQLDMLPIIIYVKEISFEEALEGRMAYNRNTNTIKWHPLAGLYTDENHLLSPTTVLNHEFDHALRYLLKPNQFIQDLITDDNSYDNREEERVITGSERQTAINLGEIFPWQITRKFHLGAAVKVKSPTSIEVQPPYRINSPIKELEEIEVNDSLDY